LPRAERRPVEAASEPLSVAASSLSSIPSHAPPKDDTTAAAEQRARPSADCGRPPASGARRAGTEGRGPV